MRNSATLEIHRLINKLSYYAEMIYSDALLLDLIEFSEFWKDAVSQISEIKRAINLKFSVNTQDNLIDIAIKEALQKSFLQLLNM